MKTASLESRIEVRREWLCAQIESLNQVSEVATDEEKPIIEARMEQLLEELAELQMYTMGF